LQGIAMEKQKLEPAAAIKPKIQLDTAICMRNNLIVKNYSMEKFSYKSIFLSIYKNLIYT